MPNQATWIVPPMALAVIFGFSAVVISARKIKLMDMASKPAGAVTYSQKDKVSEMDFSALVQFVQSKLASADETPSKN